MGMVVHPAVHMRGNGVVPGGGYSVGLLLKRGRVDQAALHLDEAHRGVVVVLVAVVLSDVCINGVVVVLGQIILGVDLLAGCPDRIWYVHVDWHVEVS